MAKGAINHASDFLVIHVQGDRVAYYHYGYEVGLIQPLVDRSGLEAVAMMS